jgi:hypothetical protein
MGGVAAIGEHVRLCGYALAGAELHASVGDEQANAAWEKLPEDLACLVLTRSAHIALAGRMHERPDLLLAVVPD